MRYTTFQSPIGDLTLWGDDGSLMGLAFSDSAKSSQLDPTWDRDDSQFHEAVTQLRAYFGRELTEFNVPLAPRGTAFQQRVWSALTRISYGSTTTYGKLALELGDPKSVRAVGLANGRNPIAIIIPCHRVIGADGSLVGYGGGMQRKEWLLAHESGARRLPW